MKILGVIPARFASTRFPGKPLADLGGKSMVQRVYEQTSKASTLSKVVVATDHDQIMEHVRKFGGNVVLTGADHPSGTDRCQEAASLQKEPYDFVINVQGDEPFIDPAQIDLLAGSLTLSTELATLIQKITSLEQWLSPNEAKVVLNKYGEAMYFSRAPVPYIQKGEPADWFSKGVFYRHVGLYAYRSDVLKRITQLPVSKLEQAESLEQLRWIENGFRIKAVETTQEEGMCIDTPEDLDKARTWLKANGG